jgi:hypothetical protein
MKSFKPVPGPGPGSSEIVGVNAGANIYAFGSTSLMRR